MDLADALRSSRNLTTLDLSGNSVGVAGGKALADVLVSGNRTIKNLRLGSQTEQLGDEVAFAFSRVLLSRADSLWELDLRSSSIGPAGARSLAEALRAPAKLFDAGANEEQAECKAGDSSSKPPPLARTGSHLALSVTRPDGGFTASKIKILNLMSNRVDDAGACLLIASIEERGYGMQVRMVTVTPALPLPRLLNSSLNHAHYKALPRQQSLNFPPYAHQSSSSSTSQTKLYFGNVHAKVWALRLGTEDISRAEANGSSYRRFHHISLNGDRRWC